MNRSEKALGLVAARQKCLAAYVLALTTIACGSGSSGGAVGDGEHESPAPSLTAVDTPDTLLVSGRSFLRRDLWSAEELARIEYEGRAEQPSTSPEVYAAQLRGQTLHNGAWYVEVTPNLELAKRILSGAPVPDTPSQPPLEGRTVVGTDTRYHVGPNTSFPQSAIAFNNSRGSGVRISQHALYTAAHVVYDTYGDSTTVPVTKPDGWFCANGTTTANNSCTPWPSWIFGLEGTSGVSSWLPIGCWEATIPTAYVNLTDPSSPDIWNQTRFDYAAISLSDSCTLGNTGWFGTSTSLYAAPYYGEGYVEYAPCQNNQGGTSLADCTGGAWQLTGAPNTAPYIGARLWAQNSITGVVAGPELGAYTIKTTGDITDGNSGGPLYVYPLGQEPFFPVYVLGVCSRGQASGSIPPNQANEYNVYTRWSTETYNWFVTYASFPN